MKQRNVSLAHKNLYNIVCWFLLICAIY